MRRGLIVAVLVVGFACAPGAAESGRVGAPSRAQLQLMPLPLAAYGAGTGSLKPDSSSGWTTNREAAENDLDPKMTAAELARLGRTTGFDVEFDDVASLSRKGVLVDADSAVDLYRSAAGAVNAVARDRANLRRFQGKRGRSGEVFDRVSYFAVPGQPGALGVRVHFRIGALTAWETLVEWPADTVVASVGLGRTDSRDVHAEVLRLAAALKARVRGVLAGTVHDKPLAQAGPKLGGLGKPPGGPDLSLMAVQPGDFAGAPRPKSERYVRNSDDIAEYIREFGPVTLGSASLASLRADVELRPDAKTAKEDLAVLRVAFSGSKGRAFMLQALKSDAGNAKIHLGTLSSTRVAAGDEALAVAATFTVSGVKFDFVICVVRRGAAVETLSALSLPGGKIPRLATDRLARIAVARIDQALH